MAYEIVVVGTSWGGLQALGMFLEGLSRDFSLPLAIVQHRSRASGEMLVELLQKHSALIVKEPEDKEVINSGHVYLSPADYHLLVDDGTFALSTDPPVEFARPSIDVLFESASHVYGAGVIGIVLTGANEDGARGLATIKARGGLALVQDPKTATSNIMPEAAISACDVDRVLPLPEIAPFLVHLLNQ